MSECTCEFNWWGWPEQEPHLIEADESCPVHGRECDNEPDDVPDDIWQLGQDRYEAGFKDWGG